MHQEAHRREEQGGDGAAAHLLQSVRAAQQGQDKYGLPRGHRHRGERQQLLGDPADGGLNRGQQEATSEGHPQDAALMIFNSRVQSIAKTKYKMHKNGCYAYAVTPRPRG